MENLPRKTKDLECDFDEGNRNHLCSIILNYLVYDGGNNGSESRISVEDTVTKTPFYQQLVQLSPNMTRATGLFSQKY